MRSPAMAAMVLVCAGVAAKAETAVGDHPVREYCEGRARVVGTLADGEPVDLGFAITGEMGACYKVSARGGTLKGYVPAAAVSSKAFEAGRRSAGMLGGSGAGTAAANAPPAAGSPGVVQEASRLLSGNQPARALEVLEKALSAGSKDASVLAMAGLAAYHSDRPSQAIRYLEESLDLREDARVEALLARARRESTGDTSSGQIVGIRFQFRYDNKEVTPAQARALVEALDGAFNDVAEKLGCRTEERITAIIQSREAYLRSTGAAEWSGGMYDGRIRVAMLEPSPGAETREAFAHEIVHACLARTGQWPAWLHEGLAQYLSGRRASAEERALVKRMVSAKALPALEQLSGSWSRMSTAHAQAAYAAALVAADAMYSRMGADGVRSLIQNPDRLTQTSRQADQWLRQ